MLLRNFLRFALLRRLAEFLENKRLSRMVQCRGPEAGTRRTARCRLSGTGSEGFRGNCGPGPSRRTREAIVLIAGRLLECEVNHFGRARHRRRRRSTLRTIETAGEEGNTI